MSLDMSPGIYHGALIEVVEAEGTGLVGDHAAGAAVLTVAAGGFRTAGQCRVDGNVYDYVRDGDSLTITPPLVGDAEDGTPVESLTPEGEPETQKKAIVDLDMLGEEGETGTEDENLPRAWIPGELAGYYPMGTAAAGAMVNVGDTAYGYRLVGRPTDAPQLDGASVDASTLDTSTMPPVPTTDGVAPDNATTVTPIGGIGSMFYRWTEITNPDPVTYRLHVRAGADPTTTGTFEVAAGVGLTSSAVRKLADGTAIVGDGSVTYHAIVTVEDADGPGPASAAVTGVPAQVTGPDIATNAVTTDMLVFNDGFAVNLTGETITGATFQTSNIPDQGIHLDALGLRAYGPGGGAPFLNVDPAAGLVIVAGEGTFDKLTTTGDVPAGESSAELGGITEVKSGGTIRLTSGATPPTAAPTVGSTYDTVQFDDDGKWADRRGWTTDGTYWYTVLLNVGGGGWLEKWNAAGAKVASVSLGTTINWHGVAHHAGKLYVLWEVGVYRYLSSTLGYDSKVGFHDFSGPHAPAIGVDAATGDLLIAQSRASDGKVVIGRYTMPAASGDDLVAGASVVTDFALDTDLAGITYGTHDLGANRYIFTSTGTGVFRSIDTTGAAVTAENWPSGMGGKVGFTYAGGVFVSMDKTGLMRTYTGQDKATAIGHADLTKWVSSTNFRDQATDWETPQSTRKSYSQPKRSKLTVTTAGLPATPGANDPNQVQVYVGKGATDPARTAMWRQTTPAVGATAAAYSSLATSGTNPPTANNFPAATPSLLEATTGGFTVDSVSNGSVGTGTFRDSVRAATAGDYAAGAWTAYTPTFTAGTTNPTLGNFTRTGRYIQTGKTVHFSIVLTANAGTGLGVGTYQFGLPVAAADPDAVVVHAQQMGPIKTYLGRGASTTSVFLYLTSDFSVANNTTTGMANGTVLRISGTYEAA